ncbi:claudin domain-containing protein 2-like isoform X2 [Rhinatrema bivittatum]|nr:claudin domain-containing protein 2-like isoform X2 [Rhinatrema bivittatum]
MKILQSAGVMLCCSTLVLQLIATTSSYWYYITQAVNTEESYHAGLWRICSAEIYRPTKEYCGNYLWIPEILDVIRAFLVLAVISNCLAVFSGISSFLCKAVTTALLFSMVCTFVSGVFALIGMAVFTWKMLDDINNTLSPSSSASVQVSWAFTGSWLTVPALTVAGTCNLLAYMAKRKQGADPNISILESSFSPATLMMRLQALPLQISQNVPLLCESQDYATPDPRTC